MHIFLLGFMGTGKSHWGRVIAQDRGLNFFDLDTEVEKIKGCTIAEIFAEEGEESFRKTESDTLHSLSHKNHKSVVSTGGGTPCFYDNMDWMNKHGLTIFLNATPAFIVKNISSEKSHRPLIAGLTDEELYLFAERKMQERLPFYQLSRVTVDADNVTLQIFNELIDKNF